MTTTSATANALRLLATGRTITETADATGLPASAVRGLINGQKGWLVNEAGRVYDPTQPGGQVRLPASAQDTPAKPGRRAAPPGGSVDELLAHASELNDKTIQTQLRKTLDQIAKLRAQVDEARQRKEAEAQRAADIAAAERELQELQARIDQTRQRIKDLKRGKPGKPWQRATPSHSPTAAIRAWARANNIPVPARGRIPAAVIDQYNAAHKDRT